MIYSGQRVVTAIVFSSPTPPPSLPPTHTQHALGILTHAYSLTHSLTYSLTYLLTYLLTYILTYLHNTHVYSCIHQKRHFTSLATHFVLELNVFWGFYNYFDIVFVMNYLEILLRNICCKLKISNKIPISKLWLNTPVDIMKYSSRYYEIFRQILYQYSGRY